MKMFLNSKKLKEATRFLPTDLAAAYKAYHSNKAEEMKLFKTLQNLEFQKRITIKSFKKQKALLEKELKNQAEEYFHCHRVFSEESLISTTNSLKGLYLGPLPTKAVLPKGKLNHLQTILRNMQDDTNMFSNTKKHAIVGWLVLPSYSKESFGTDELPMQFKNLSETNLSGDVHKEKTVFYSSENAKKLQSQRTRSAPVPKQGHMYQKVKRPNTTITRPKKEKTTSQPQKDGPLKRPKSSPFYNMRTKTEHQTSAFSKLKATAKRHRSALTSKQKRKEQERGNSSNRRSLKIQAFEEEFCKDKQPSSASLQQDKKEESFQITNEGQTFSDMSNEKVDDNSFQKDTNNENAIKQPVNKSSKCLTRHQTSLIAKEGEKECRCSRFSIHQTNVTPRKRKMSTFKKETLTNTLYGKQVVIESDIREKVNRFVSVAT